MKRYILKDGRGNMVEFHTDNLRNWLINHVDLSEQYEVFEFKYKTE